LFCSRCDEALDSSRADRADHLAGFVDTHKQFFFGIGALCEICFDGFFSRVREKDDADFVAFTTHREFAAADVNVAAERAEFCEAQAGREKCFEDRPIAERAERIAFWRREQSFEVTIFYCFDLPAWRLWQFNLLGEMALMSRLARYFRKLRIAMT